jgi:hypothetical protein
VRRRVRSRREALRLELGSRRRSASTGAESASTGADLLQQETNQPIGGRGWWIGGRGDGGGRSSVRSFSLSRMAIFQFQYVFWADLLGCLFKK